MADLIGGLHLVNTEPLRLSRDETGTNDVEFTVSAAGVLTVTPMSGEKVVFGYDAEVGSDLLVDATLTITGVSLFTGSAGFGTAALAAVRVLLAAGSASLAPMRLTSGTVLTTPVAGSVEFLTDDYFLTISTGTARKGIVLDDGSRLSSGSIPKASTNGRLIDGPAYPFANKFIVQGTADAGLSAAQFMGALGTGIVKNTTTTGVLSIAVAGDFPTLNQNTSGSAATLTTTRTIWGQNFDGSANVSGAFSGATTMTWSGNVLNDLLFTDATYDIGKSGATRPRDGFFSRNVAIGGTLVVSSTGSFDAAGGNPEVLRLRGRSTDSYGILKFFNSNGTTLYGSVETDATSFIFRGDTSHGIQFYVNQGTLAIEVDTSAVTTLHGDLKFTDATYDIGKSGATRPRDIFTSRALSVGGNFACNGATPAAAPDYTVTNPTTNRSLNVTGATLAQLAQVVGTMIADHIAIGLYQ